MRFGRIVVLSAVGLGLLAGTSALAQTKADPASASVPALPEKAADAHPSSSSNIEDSSLEGLLDLNLEDKLGKTEAVSRTNESVLRAPAAMTTLDAQQIRLSGATTVPDVLRFVPGVAVTRNAPGDYVVSLRGTGGLASNNVILLIDGIPINNPLDGTVSWDLVPLNLEDIERIEVVRGPVSPIYGANAYTGVINIVTRTTVGLIPSYVARIRGGIDTKGGTAGLASGRFIHMAKRLQFKMFLTAEHDGISTKPVSGKANDDAPAMDQVGTTAELNLLPSQSSRVSIEAGFVWSRRSGMDHLALDAGAAAQRLLFGRALYELRWENGANFRVWGQAVSFANDADPGGATGFSYAGAKAFRGAGGADLVLALSPAFSVLAGGQASAERVDATFVHPNVDGHFRPSYGFYGGLKASFLSALDFVVTGRGDLSPISAKLEYSYRASAIYHANTWGVRLTGASAFRSPTYIEAAGRFIDPASGLILLEGTDTIGAPRNTSVELGATFSPFETLTVSPTVYWSRLSNLMVEDFDSIVRRTFHNDPNARTLLGAELEAKWRVTETVAVMPSLSVLDFLTASERIDTNVGVPSQNAKYMAGLQVQGIFGDDTWGYGIGGTYASARSFNVRAGIPPLVLTSAIPATTRLFAMLDHQLVQTPSLWVSLRLGATLPANQPESPLPSATPLGQSAILGFSIRRD
jgi:outer membrane receptor protein involved in Fe transport